MFGLTRSVVLAGFVALAWPAGARAALPYGAAWKLNITAISGYDLQSLNDIALAPDGNLIAVGNQVVNANPTPVIVKLTPTGTVLWAKPSVSSYFGHAVAVGADGKIYVGGGGVGGASGTVFVAAYDADGNQLWSYTDLSLNSNAITSIAVNSSGKVFAATNTAASAFLIGVAAGSLTDSKSGPSGGLSGAVIVDAADNVWVASSGSTCNEMFISRFAAGALSRTDYQGGSLSGCGATFTDMQIAADGSVWAFSGQPSNAINSDPSGVAIMHVTAAAPPAGIGLGVYAHALPTTVDSTSSSGVGMTAGALLPSGLVAGSWGNGGSAGVTGGELTDFCGPGGCFNASWVTALPSDFRAVRMLVAGKYLFVAGARDTGGGGPDDQRFLLVALGDSGIKLPDTMKMSVRNNVIRTEAGDKAVIVLHGTPGANVEIAIYGPSGARVGEYADVVQLDTTGVGSVIFDGTSNGAGGFKLGSGVYWIVARDGVSDRKPVLIIGPAQGASDSTK